jgi:hypothetical protein
MVSDTGCSLTVAFNFKDPAKRVNKKGDAVIPMQEQAHSNTASKVNEQQNGGSQERPETPQHAFIQRNIEFVDLYDPERHAQQIFQNRIDMEAKNMQVVCKKEQIQIDNYKYKQFLLIKWDLIKQKKLEMQREANERHKNIHRGTKWVKLIALLMCVNHVRGKLLKEKMRRRLGQLKLQVRLKTIKCFRSYLSSKTPVAKVQNLKKKVPYESKEECVRM